MGVVAYIDYTDAGNDAAVALIEADADPAVVTYRIPANFAPCDADPLETVVYAQDASAAILAATAAVGVTAASIEGLP